MNRSIRHTLRLLALGAFPMLAACNRAAPPQVASSAAEPAYAERYPSALAAVRIRFAEDEQAAHESAGKLATYPSELKDPAWTYVGVVVDIADQGGKSADFTSGMLEIEQVQNFYGAEREPIRQKVAGAAAYVVKQKKECEVDVYGPTAAALDKAIDKQTKEWRKAHSPADRYIDDHTDAIGKANVDKLGEQADHISVTSYIVRVRLPRAKGEIDALTADASDVKQTLDRTLADAKAVLDDPTASKSAKELAHTRSDAASRAQSSLDGEVTQARALSGDIERRTKVATDEYEKALADLKAAIKAQADKQPKK